MRSQNNKLRPVINLISLNNCVQLEKFKLEGLDMVRTLLTPGDYLMKLDLKDAYFTVLIYEPHKKYLRFQFHLKDAYFTVPIYEPHKKYLRFQFQNITYGLQCLPFGLSTAPRAFTKLLKPVIAILRSSGIRIVIYLDDILVMHQEIRIIRR